VRGSSRNVALGRVHYVKKLRQERTRASCSSMRYESSCSAGTRAAMKRRRVACRTRAGDSVHRHHCGVTRLAFLSRAPVHTRAGACLCVTGVLRDVCLQVEVGRRRHLTHRTQPRQLSQLLAARRSGADTGMRQLNLFDWRHRCGVFGTSHHKSIVHVHTRHVSATSKDRPAQKSAPSDAQAASAKFRPTSSRTGKAESQTKMF
jgi:hypothetical protein